MQQPTPERLNNIYTHLEISPGDISEIDLFIKNNGGENLPTQNKEEKAFALYQLVCQLDDEFFQHSNLVNPRSTIRLAFKQEIDGLINLPEALKLKLIIMYATHLLLGCYRCE